MWSIIPFVESNWIARVPIVWMQYTYNWTLDRLIRDSVPTIYLLKLPVKITFLLCRMTFQFSTAHINMKSKTKCESRVLIVVDLKEKKNKCTKNCNFINIHGNFLTSTIMALTTTELYFSQRQSRILFIHASCKSIRTHLRSAIANRTKQRSRRRQSARRLNEMMMYLNR